MKKLMNIISSVFKKLVSCPRIPFTLIICSLSITCHASDNVHGARKFMTEFLEMEYIGNPSFRVDNAIYSPERKLWVDKKFSDTNAEIYSWDGYQICVVDSYEIKEIKIINQRAIIGVVFKEFAHTDGEKGYGDSPLIKTEKKYKEKYYLEYKNDRWWIYNPPIPRVSKKALIEHNDEIIKRMSDWILQEGSNEQNKYYHNLINANNLLKENTTREKRVKWKMWDSIVLNRKTGYRPSPV